MDAGGLRWSAARLGTGRAGQAWWLGRRAAAAGERLGEKRLRARAPGAVLGAEAGPGGGLVRCERSELRVRVAVGGAVFLGWDGAEPRDDASGGGHGCPPPDGRATLEPDTDGGWRVVSQRVLLTVGRDGVVRVRTPGGVLLRRDAPPRWWESEPGTGGAWLQRSRVRADARFLDADGRRVRPGVRAALPQLVVARAGTHLMFHDGRDAGGRGRVTVREGVPGEGSGHDREGRSELRVPGGPVAYWVLVGPSDWALREWADLSGGGDGGSRR
ncbi:hypothetical protein [Streptomyces sp. JJ38]|uniref:hypothetical protein n=1 Tax=Streptomyces sp. JJ38 TaxID=2738128 RepID=UPI001C5661E5|nr:hypothetical protein [Streptomyces sp. JJ38]MBW1600300.1 hypothetical protein [Streptomyces sp. JJ38]